MKGTTTQWVHPDSSVSVRLMPIGWLAALVPFWMARRTILLVPQQTPLYLAYSEIMFQVCQPDWPDQLEAMQKMREYIFVRQIIPLINTGNNSVCDPVLQIVTSEPPQVNKESEAK